MKKRRWLQKVFTGTLAFSLLFQNVGFTTAFASEDLRINIVPNSKVDVVLTVGNTNMNLNNFASDIRRELSERGIDPSRVNIQAIEVEEVNIQDSFNWLYYGHDICDGWCPPNGKRINVTNNGRDLFFDGYSRYGYADFMYMRNDDPGKKTFTFKLDEKLNDYHAMEGAGFLFNTDLDQSKGTIKGYAVIIGPQIRLYRIDTTINRFFNSSTDGLSGKATLLASFQKVNTLNHDIRIEVDRNTISMWDNGKKLIDNYRLPIDYGVYGFGPIASHVSHNCSVRSQFTFKNLKMETSIVRQFNEVIREPEWRDNSDRFLVNAEDQVVASLEDPHILSEVLTRLINEEIHYVALGTNANRQQAERLIAQNNDKGTFILNTNYSSAMDQLADYIADVVDASLRSRSSEYVLLGDPMNIKVYPEHLKTNTQTPEYPQGRWRIDHDHTYFENNLGQYSKSGLYQPDLDLVLDKTGKYELWFEDKHPHPRYVYVHRKPIADFSVQLNKSGSDYTVSIVDYSYDPDNESAPDRGIAEYEWKWKETTADSWTEGPIPSTLPAGKDYIVQLRVKDHQGTWSTPEARYISTSDASIKPIASFKMPSEATRYQTVSVVDTSYDPTGKSIVEKQWTVKKDGTQIYSGSTPITDFSAYGEGAYEVTLKVKNSAGLWSEEFKRIIVITSDKINPEVIFDLTRKDWTNQDVTVTITFYDEGGSGFNAQRYAVTNSPTPPATGWSEWSNEPVRVVTLTEDGKWYIHVEAKDNEGNLTQRTAGEYQIDKTPPEQPVFVPDKTSPTNENVVVSIVYPADAVVKEFKVNDGMWMTYNAPIVMEDNGVIYARAIDAAGNMSESEYEVSFIDRVPPELPVFVPDKTRPTNQDVTVTIVYPDDAVVVEYKIGDGEWMPYTAPIVMTENGIVYARAVDAAGNEVIGEYTVSNIDKVPPSAPEVIVDVDTVIVVPGKDDKNSVAVVQVRINGGEWKNYTSPIKLPDGEYTVEAKAIDDAGNESYTTILFFVYNDTLKKAEQLVRAAEAYPTESKINQAREAVLLLPDVAPEKQELLERLDNLEFQMKANEAIKKVELAEKYKREPYIGNAYEAVNKLPDGDLKQELLDRLQAILDELERLLREQEQQKQQEQLNKLIEEAIKKVELAEKFKREPYLQNAFDAVNALPEGEIKQELLNRLQAILDELEQLRQEKERQEQEKQLNKLIEEARKKVELAERNKREPYLQNAYDAVNALPECEEKEVLKSRLDAIQKELERMELDKLIAEATKKVELAEKMRKEAYIRQAEEAVNKLPECEEKDALKARLDALKRMLEDEALEKLFQEAEKKVEQAEKYQREPYISNAYEAVYQLPDGERKAALEARLDAIVIGDGKDSLYDEWKKIRDLQAKLLFLDIIKAVERAEKYFSRANIVYAIDKIDRVPDELKEEYKSLFDVLNGRVEKLKATYNAVIADKHLETLIKKAETAVETYERFRTAALKEKAQQAVDALTEPNIKERLQQRIDAVVMDN